MKNVVTLLIPNPMSMGSRIRAARRAAGVKQVALAEQLGVSAQAVNQWEADKYQPTKENLLKLSQLLGISVGFLLQPEPLPEQSANGILRHKSGVVLEGQAVPLVSRDQICAGNKISLAKTSVYTSHECGPDAFAVRVWDRSHEPHLPVGTVLIYDPGRVAEPGDFVIASHDGKTISGILSMTAPDDPHSIAIDPLNEHWPAWRSTKVSPIVVVAVKTETHLRG